MKMFVLSDNTDTCTGMRLAGIDGVVVHERDELLSALDKVVRDGNYGIVLITEKLRKLGGDVISQMMIELRSPVFLEIPDRHGFGRSGSSMTDYIRTTIGLKID